jgi:hypothetical protein
MTPQQQFEADYVTSCHLYKRYDINRSRLHYLRHRGLLPMDLEIEILDMNLLIWRRKEIEPILDELERSGKISRRVKV